jgi:hypothetical protein
VLLFFVNSGWELASCTPLGLCGTSEVLFFSNEEFILVSLHVRIFYTGACRIMIFKGLNVLLGLATILFSNNRLGGRE